MAIRFHPDRHSAMLAALGRGADGIQGALDTLDREAAALRGSWSGEAQKAYDTAHAEWTAAMAALRSALVEAAKAADAAGTRLAEADAEVAALWT